MLYECGVSLPRAIEHAAPTTGNWLIERSLLKAVPLLKQGATLEEAFGRSRLLAPMVRQMMSVGEQSGKLGHTLLKTSELLSDEARQPVLVAVSTLEGILILLLGLLIISGFLPM